MEGGFVGAVRHGFLEYVCLCRLCESVSAPRNSMGFVPTLNPSQLAVLFATKTIERMAIS